MTRKMSSSAHMNIQSSALLTDFYQLTMLQAYLEQGMEDTAVFEFFVRELPENRNFLIAAGLEQVLDFLTDVQLTSQDLEWVKRSGKFSAAFVDYLEAFRFEGDVHAMVEGTIFFPQEPILRITAPLPQAQLVESRVINLIHFQTLIASKAIRCVLAAPDKLLVDFGMRRAHGAEAGLLAARAGYLAGLDGTATVIAGKQFDIPVFGTMAHSFIQAHDNESLAFEHFAHTQPGNVVLLIDTYDTEEAARKVVTLARTLQDTGIKIKGVRIDSGDLLELARRVRRILDDGGLNEVTIFASGNLDEHQLAEFRAAKAPIDGFGIGTQLDTSADRPYLDCAYKLQEYAGRARRKRSKGKATWPGRKQVYRHFDVDGSLMFDVVAVEGERQTGVALLEAVMHAGEKLRESVSLSDIRRCVREDIRKLPEPLRDLRQHAPYTVEISEALRQLATAVDSGH
jgi:nicotinate phosphoribosyltransferase